MYVTSSHNLVGRKQMAVTTAYHQKEHLFSYESKKLYFVSPIEIEKKGVQVLRGEARGLKCGKCLSMGNYLF